MYRPALGQADPEGQVRRVGEHARTSVDFRRGNQRLKNAMFLAGPLSHPSRPADNDDGNAPDGRKAS
jgi:hypothetical protein